MAKQRLILLSCHEILEFDELKLFHELGYEVFSPGAYVCNENRGSGNLRPSIPGLVYDSNITEQWHRDIASKHPGEDGKDYLTKEFIDNFDIVVVMHLPRWVANNWEVIKHKRVIWRTIGQSVPSTEDVLRHYRREGMEIVRYSPKEASMPNFIGQDALIRFYKDPEEYKGWTGWRKKVITLAQSMKSRNAACNFTFFEEVTRPFERTLFGPGNEDAGPWAEGKVSYERLKAELRDNRVYFYTGTHPASYTLNFIEAWLSGIPVIAIGPQHGNASYFPGVELYEVSDLITNGINGFVSDDIAELRGYISALFSDYELAKRVGEAGREAAITHFGKDLIKASWAKFLGE